MNLLIIPESSPNLENPPARVARLPNPEVPPPKADANPPKAPNQYPALSDQIERVARAYLNPYVLPQEKHAAVAMNSVQALAALASPEFGAVIAEVSTCCPPWFRQQLQLRLTKLQEEWRAKLGEGVTVHQPMKTVQEVSDCLRTD